MPRNFQISQYHSYFIHYFQNRVSNLVPIRRLFHEKNLSCCIQTINKGTDPWPMIRAFVIGYLYMQKFKILASLCSWAGWIEPHLRPVFSDLRPNCTATSGLHCHNMVHGMRGSRGGTGVRTPLKSHKAIVFVSSTGPHPLENHKTAKPAFNVGPPSTHQWKAI